jgi:hypothetical protein
MEIDKLLLVLQLVRHYEAEIRIKVRRRARLNFRRAWLPWIKCKRSLAGHVKENEFMCVIHCRSANPQSVGMAVCMIIRGSTVPLVNQASYSWGERGHLVMQGTTIKLGNPTVSIGPLESDNNWMNLFMNGTNLVQTNNSVTTIIRVQK